jgi:hypothetical protein
MLYEGQTILLTGLEDMEEGNTLCLLSSHVKWPDH